MIRAAFLGFGWLRPSLLVLAAVALLVLALGLWTVSSRRRTVATLVARRQLARFAPSLSFNRARARFVLASAALAALALAAAGPVRGHTLREVRRRGLDIVVCIDTSRSMLVRDLRPDRITRARREVLGLLDRLRGDRMALIAFAGDAREVAPLTHDRSALAHLLEGVSPAENEKGGTDLGAALERALALFDGRTGAHEAIALLTDGEDLEGRGLEVARKARERNVKVFVVGMGTEAGGKIPVPRPGGGETFLRDKQNQEVVSAMGGRGLEELAATTGGAYLSAEASAGPLEELYDKRVSRLEARELQGGQEYVPHDRYQWFLGAAAACALLAAGLRERRAPKKPRPVRAPRAAKSPGVAPRPAWARAFAPWFLLAPAQLPTQPPGLAPGVEPPAVTPEKPPPYAGDPRAGREELRRALDAQDPERVVVLAASLLAREDLAEAARAGVEYDLGSALERAGSFEDAALAFSRAGGLAPAGPLRLDAWYNEGTARLEGAELLFLALPEVREAKGLPPLAPPAAPPQPAPLPGAPHPPGPGPAAAPEAPDQDLEQARAAYLAAKQSLVFRWRADAADIDTRANLELAQRRLRELDRLQQEREQKREEEQQQDPKQDPNQDPKQDPKQDPNQDPQDAKQEPKPPENQGEQQDPKDSNEPQKPDEPAQPPKPEEQQQGTPKEAPKPGEMRELSKEEVSRLLQQLANLEQEAKQLEQRLRAVRRQPVERDW